MKIFCDDLLTQKGLNLYTEHLSHSKIVSNNNYLPWSFLESANIVNLILTFGVNQIHCITSQSLQLLVNLYFEKLFYIIR
jgi:hypothetical protein